MFKESDEKQREARYVLQNQDTGLDATARIS